HIARACVDPKGEPQPSFGRSLERHDLDACGLLHHRPSARCDWSLWTSTRCQRRHQTHEHPRLSRTRDHKGGSSLRHSRRMFSSCRTNTSVNKPTAIQVRGDDPPSIPQVAPAPSRAPPSEPTLALRVTFLRRTYPPAAASPAGGASASNAPTALAAPFPPR